MGLQSSSSHLLIDNMKQLKTNPQFLVMTAVEVEQAAVLRGLENDPRFDVRLAGVGPVAAAVNTAKALATSNYSLVISAGIGGGFSGRAKVGSLVLADEIIAADLGVETTEGFSSINELGFGEIRISVDPSLVGKLLTGLLDKQLEATSGAVLTVSTATGTAESAKALLSRVQGASAEAMEGYGVAFAAQEFGIPVMELRAISNVVGPRDRTAWRIKEALATLEAASLVLTEVF